MADQGRWFKLWITAPDDDGVQALPPALRWAWVAFGCYTKAHGTHGQVQVSPTNAALAAQMCVPIEDLQRVISVLPNVHVEEGQHVNGTFTVTWKNWIKYQEDSTVAERMKAYRSRKALRRKRRREEKRGDEKRTDSSPLTPLLVDEPANHWPSPASLVSLYNAEAPEECPSVQTLSKGRLAKARQYLAAFPELAWWQHVFSQMRASRFLRGLSKKQAGHESFVADLDWLLTKGKDGTENAVKVHDGRYLDG